MGRHCDCSALVSYSLGPAAVLYTVHRETLQYSQEKEDSQGEGTVSRQYQEIQSKKEGKKSSIKEDRKGEGGSVKEDILYQENSHHEKEYNPNPAPGNLREQ